MAANFSLSHAINSQIFIIISSSFVLFSICDRHVFLIRVMMLLLGPWVVSPTLLFFSCLSFQSVWFLFYVFFRVWIIFVLSVVPLFRLYLHFIGKNRHGKNGCKYSKNSEHLVQIYPIIMHSGLLKYVCFLSLSALLLSGFFFLSTFCQQLDGAAISKIKSRIADITNLCAHKNQLVSSICVCVCVFFFDSPLLPSLWEIQLLEFWMTAYFGDDRATVPPLLLIISDGVADVELMF